jgi:carbonic anhydrase
MDMFEYLLQANARVAEGFPHAGLPRDPAWRLAVLTCMDSRVDPRSFLGINPGDAHVLRNAGGRVTEDVLRSLTVSIGLMGVTAVAVVHHTDCGLQARSFALRDTLAAAGVSGTGLELHSFTDLEESVRDDVAMLERNPVVRLRAHVRGFIYRVEDGRLTAVRP